MSIPVFSRFPLGHSSIKVTMDVYGHLFPSETEKLAAALGEVYRDSVMDKTDY